MAKSKIEKPPVRIEKSREYLRYDFSEEELKEFAKGMARTHQELARSRRKRPLLWRSSNPTSKLRPKPSVISRGG